MRQHYNRSGIVSGLIALALGLLFLPADADTGGAPASVAFFEQQVVRF